jgi:plastocyanin
MISTRFCKSAAMSLSLAGLFFVSVSGCGGKGEGVDDAVVTPAPGEANTAGGGGGGGAAATSTEKKTETAATDAKPTAEAAPVKSEGWGTLKGRVVFDSSPPTMKVLVPKGATKEQYRDGDVCGKNEIKSQFAVVDPETKGVRFALVYIPKPTAVHDDAKKAASTAAIEFDQKGCVFDPHVLCVMKGAKLVLKSSDPVGHNIDAKMRANGAYNKLIAANQSIDYSPSTAERSPCKVVCDIHPWMSAHWMVLDNPYFAVTDAKGNFEIKNVPAGTQKVVVWHEALQKGGFLTSASGDAVNVKADGETTQEYKIESSKLATEQ